MFFLLRVAFWLTLVLALLPTGKPSSANGPGASEAVAAATAAVADVSHFCQRQAEACEVGSQAAVLIGQRAQAGAKMVFELIQDHLARGGETGSVPSEKSAAGRRGAVPRNAGSQNTLAASDLEPAWRGPAPRTETVPLPPPRPTRPADRIASAR
jgi:hypothetical protein